jgi:hypothetical protein
LLFGKLFKSLEFESASLLFQKEMLLCWIALLIRFSKWDFRVVLISILFFGNAIRLDLELGQINAFVLVSIVILFDLLERKKNLFLDLSFGLIFSLAVQMKLFALLFVPVLVFRSEWRKLGFGVLLLPLMSIGGVALAHGWSFAVSENVFWLRSLGGSTEELLRADQNVGLLGFLVRSFGLEFGKALWIVSGAGFAAYIWRNRFRPVGWMRDWLLFGVAVFNPLVWSYWILYALPLFSGLEPDFEGAFRRRSRLVRYSGLLAGIFVFSAFNAQHAKWAWSWGLLVGLGFLGFAASRVRSGRA